jgi:CBS domain-containing protein
MNGGNACLAPAGWMPHHSRNVKLLRDVAIRHLVTVAPQTTLRRAAKVMTDRGVGAAVVVHNEKVAGIVTERDILHAIANNDAPGWDILRAVATMTEHGFRHLLVMEMDDPVGIVSLRDLMDQMAEMVQEQSASE